MILNAAQFYMHGLSDLDATLVEVYQSREYSPDFFAWVIPMSKDSAKVGLGTSKKAAAKELTKMISSHPILKEKCDGAEIRRKTAGRIPISGPVKKTYTNGFLMTGDVAGQTKPTTGGGVILGGIAAQIAGEIGARGVHEGRTEAKYLKQYEKRWKKEIHRNLKMMLLVRKYLNVLKDKEVDKLFETIEQKGIVQKIEEHGHIDNQGKLVLRLMKTLSLYPFYLRTSGRLTRSLFSL
jgi:digeranylgeranylglycerophospholipid reductase